MCTDIPATSTLTPPLHHLTHLFPMLNNKNLHPPLFLYETQSDTLPLAVYDILKRTVRVVFHTNQGACAISLR